MGGCGSRDKSAKLVGVPEEENYVYKSECRLRLNEVNFLTFQGAIKRFGYRIDLNDEHMRSISKEIKLNVDAMNSIANSPFAVVYKDEQFFFKGRRHTVPNLVKLGFLCCQHNSIEDQEFELWHLINPKLEETVSKAVVEAFLKDLTYCALEMNLNLLKMSDENDTQEKQHAIDYLENAIKLREDFVKKTTDQLTERVTKDQLCNAMRDTYFKSYLLRLKISGKELGAGVKQNIQQ